MSGGVVGGGRCGHPPEQVRTFAFAAAGRPCDAGQNEASGTRIRVCWVLGRLSQQMASSRSTAVTVMHAFGFAFALAPPNELELRGATRSKLENTAARAPF